MESRKITRRKFVAGTAAAAGMISAPYVRRANAAGTLTIGLWDHWVPGANDVQSAIVKEWADKEKVDVKIDYITSQGNKLLLTIAAESQAKSGTTSWNLRTGSRLSMPTRSNPMTIS